MQNNRRLDGASIARIAVFAALIAVLGLPGAIPAFGGAVPITAQTLGVMLAGTILGPWRGAAAVIVFQLLVIAGLPLLSGGRGGIGVYAGPSAGYLIGWILGAIIVGLITRAHLQKPTLLRTALGAVVGGILAIYLIGIPVQSAVTGLSLGETVIASLVFLPGDLIKAAITVGLTLALWRAYPRAFGQGSPARRSTNRQPASAAAATEAGR